MNLSILERRRLAMAGDDSPKARSLRLRAARSIMGAEPEDIASQWGVQVSPKLAHVIAAERGEVPPDSLLQSVYWRALRLRPAFFDDGNIDNVPFDIEDDLFEALKLLRGHS